MTDREPERLRVVGATDLEKRLLAAAAGETPSPELRRRMARAVGVAAGRSDWPRGARTGGRDGGRRR